MTEQIMQAEFERHIEEDLSLWAYLGMMHAKGILQADKYLEKLGYQINYETMKIVMGSNI